MKKTRATVVKENPGMAFGDIGRELGKRWKSLSASEKAKYEAE